MPKTSKPSSGQVESVEKAFQVLQTVAAAHRIGVLKLSQDVALPYSTVHRLLRTLETLGYIVQTGDRSQYSLGPKVLELGTAFLDHLELRQEALPFMTSLNQETKETVNLVMWNGSSAFCIEKIDSTESVTIQQTQVGRIEPVHSTGLGKAILAQYDPETAAEILRKVDMVPYTVNTITSVAVFMKELDVTRSRGYAIDDEEGLIGIRCVAAAVFDHQGRPAGAISLAAPAIRMNRRRMTELGPMVRDVAFRISRRLGYHQPAENGNNRLLHR